MTTQEKLAFILEQLVSGCTPKEIAFDRRLTTSVPEMIEMVGLITGQPPMLPKRKRKKGK